jgi:RimJ/RimL family protein N-acetyltransferase
MGSEGKSKQLGVASTVSPISLDGRVVRLRPITKADYGFLWQCRSNPEIMPLWMQGRTIPSFEQYVRELEASLSGHTLALLLIETSIRPQPIGFAIAYDYSQQDRYTFFNIVLTPGFTDLGWGAEAALLFLDYLFAYFDLRKVCTDLFDFNQQPLAMLMRQGVPMEGRFRGQRYYQGMYHDVIRLGLLEEEWRSARDQLAALLGAPALAPSSTSVAPAEGVGIAPARDNARGSGDGGRSRGARYAERQDDAGPAGEP